MQQTAAVDPWIAFQKVAKKTTPPTDISGYAQTRLIDFQLQPFFVAYGFVAKVGTIKTPTGYGVSWTTRFNTRDSLEYGFTVSIIWGAKWNTLKHTDYIKYHSMTSETAGDLTQWFTRVVSEPIMKPGEDNTTLIPGAGFWNGQSTTSCNILYKADSYGFFGASCSGFKLFSVDETNIAKFDEGAKFKWNTYFYASGVSGISSRDEIREDEFYTILDSASKLFSASAALMVVFFCF